VGALKPRGANSAPKLGVIADDYTGAADLGSQLRERGAEAALFFGVPEGAALRSAAASHDALIVALKSRSIEPGEAVRLSLEGLVRLDATHARQLYFKYCSTFDSTVRGNIGPVIDAMLDRRALAFTIAVPALPANGRTQVFGHLFVDGTLLSESSMRHHPLTPMTESNLLRHLRPQTTRQVGLIDLPTVRRGADAIARAAERLRTEGIGIALVDAMADEDVAAIAQAFVAWPVVTGGSGLAGGLAHAWNTAGRGVRNDARPPVGPATRGRGLIIAGSCSAATLGQLSAIEQTGVPLVHLDVAALVRGDLARAQEQVEAVVTRARQGGGWCGLATSTAPAVRQALLARLSAEGVASDAVAPAIERALARLTRQAVDSLEPAVVCVAGGETSGAIVDALHVRAATIGAAIAPGVPLLHERSAHRALALVLKSGNFGGEDFFLRLRSIVEGDRVR
jgi:uncharacterized protein YgbK (DUF1537 family)